MAQTEIPTHWGQKQQEKKIFYGKEKDKKSKINLAVRWKTCKLCTFDIK